MKKWLVEHADRTDQKSVYSKMSFHACIALSAEYSMQTLTSRVTLQAVVCVLGSGSYERTVCRIAFVWLRVVKLVCM